MEEIRKEELAEVEERQPDKEDYLRKIRELSPEDQAFMDGYLFAKVTERKKGA